MQSRERVRLALNHHEADRVPFDIGGTRVSLVHKTAYSKLRRYLGLPTGEEKILHLVGQLAVLEPDVADWLETDVTLVDPQPASNFEVALRDLGDYEAFTDEWEIGWKKPKKGGFYYDMYSHPLAKAETLTDFKAFKFPDPLDDRRYQNLRTDAAAAIERGKAVALASPCSGVLEMCAWTRGFEQFYVDLALEPEFITYMLERMVEFKCAYWQRALAELGDMVDVVIEADDLAGQKSLLFSPEIYRNIVKPQHKKLFDCIKQFPVKLFYHTDGAVRPLIRDLIEIGIDILNPVQFTAAKMDLKELKQEYGPDLVFWGGGVDTQGVLSSGTPAEVKADVKRNIETLAAGGGFVFSTVHNIQANVPPENIVAMWKAWQTYSVY